ncbi:MAG: PHP domain-containing protein [Clostridia bacterium]|nr:PHP domain-containing protein [Clostridia bacterium]
MILTADYHTHTPYSHGKNTVEENAAAAALQGLKQIAITDHGFTHVAFGLKRKDMPSYIQECKQASLKHGMDVLVGIEANILGESGKSDLTDKDFENFDVYLCGYHICVWYDKLSDWSMYGCGNLLSRKFRKQPSDSTLRRNTKAYINAIKNNPIDAVTHLNFCAPADAVEVAKCAADYGTYIELNSKKRHLTDEELNDIVQKTQARFIIDSDAHSADRVGDKKIVEEQLSRLSFPMDRIDNIDGRFPVFRFAEFKKHL